MGRIIGALLLSLLMLGLWGCGEAAPPPAAEPITTEPAATTTALPETTAQPSLPPDVVLARMSAGDVLVKYSRKYYFGEIWLRDTAGNETLLLGIDDEDDLFPCFIKAIDDRYFLYLLAIMDSDGFSSPILYDTQEKQTIHIQYPENSRGDFQLTLGSKIYMISACGGQGYEGVVRLNVFCADTAALAKGMPVKAVDVLKGVPEYDALPAELEECDDPQYTLSPDARYFAIHIPNEFPTLYVFDIPQRKLVLRQAQAELNELSFTDADTLTWLVQGVRRELPLQGPQPFTNADITAIEENFPTVADYVKALPAAWYDVELWYHVGGGIRIDFYDAKPDGALMPYLSLFTRDEVPGITDVEEAVAFTVQELPKALLNAGEVSIHRIQFAKTGAALPAPRGLTIGSSAQELFSTYPDYRPQSDSSGTLYGITALYPDAKPEWGEWDGEGTAEYGGSLGGRVFAQSGDGHALYAAQFIFAEPPIGWTDESKDTWVNMYNYRWVLNYSIEENTIQDIEFVLLYHPN